MTLYVSRSNRVLQMNPCNQNCSLETIYYPFLLLLQHFPKFFHLYFLLVSVKFFHTFRVFCRLRVTVLHGGLTDQ